MNTLRKLFRRVDRSTESVSSVIHDSLSEVEQKLIESFTTKPDDWQISKVPCDDETEREFSIINVRNGIRMMVREDALRNATAHRVAIYPIRCGAHVFGERFTVEFGSAIYKTFLQRESEKNIRDAERALVELKNRLGIK